MNSGPLPDQLKREPQGSYPDEKLGELLAQEESFESGAALALQFVLESANRSAGFLWAMSSAETTPWLQVSRNLPPEWAGALQDPASALYRAVCEVLRQQSSGRELEGLAAALALPGRSGPQGALFILGPAFSPEQQERLGRLGRTVGDYLSLGRSTPPRRSQLQDLPALHRLVAGLSFKADFEQSQIHILKSLCETLDCEAGSLLLQDESQPGSFTRRSLVQPARWSCQEHIQLERGLVRECLDARRTLRADHLPDEPGFSPLLDGVEGLQARGMLCAPLTVNGEVLGAIQAFNKYAGNFEADDLELFNLLVDLASQTIYGARLIQQLKVANTDLETIQGELLRSRNTLRALFDSMPASLYIVDRGYKLVAINMSRAQRAGSSPKTLVGRQCYQALYQREDACPGCRVSETLHSGQNTSRTERRWKEPDEQTDWEISTFPIVDEFNRVVQAILLEQDVTDKRRLETIVAQSEKLAAVGQLAAGVAHEINNPLTAIIANAQILQRELPADHELRESAQLIAQAGARASQVVRNLLDFARKEQYHLDLTDVNETIQNSMALIQHELNKHSIQLDFEPAGDLPLIQASRDHLLSVWLNLMLNAMDAIGEQEGRIRITTRLSGSSIRVVVSDNGKGIPPEQLTRIFEPFYTTKAPGRGTGLGLSVCHQIAKQHGGYIEVSSQVGAGSAFTVVLPVL